MAVLPAKHGAMQLHRRLDHPRPRLAPAVRLAVLGEVAPFGFERAAQVLAPGDRSPYPSGGVYGVVAGADEILDVCPPERPCAVRCCVPVLCYQPGRRVPYAGFWRAWEGSQERAYGADEGDAGRKRRRTRKQGGYGRRYLLLQATRRLLRDRSLAGFRYRSRPAHLLTPPPGAAGCAPGRRW